MARSTHLLAGLALGLLAIAFTPPQDRTAAFPRHGTFIGKADCSECHEAEAERILGGWHKSVLHDETLQQCETCHGPGKQHADDADNATHLITFPPKLGFGGQRNLCGRCHAEQIAAHGGDMAGFVAAGKKCTDCHEVHAVKKPVSHPGMTFETRIETVANAKAVGAQECVRCHPLRNELLKGTGHERLTLDHDATGCEACHGPGSLHVQSGGLTRLISRPDRAEDGLVTCMKCHSQVDPVEFHWRDQHKPLLSTGMTCTTCHAIHKGRTSSVVPALAPKTAAPTNATCARCHEPAFAVLRNTIHESLGRRDAPLGQGCGACHRGAEEHARRGGQKHLVQSMRGTTAAAQMATCAQCHDKDAALRHARRGAHHRNEVTCLTCHSPAAPKGKVREDASQRCAKCHADVAAEFKLPHHHPVDLTGGNKGGMSCVDCHDPHSARPRIRDRQLRQDNCVKCHKQYRGPFVFAHQASRIDGCVACHRPHGSTNRRMLKQHTSQQNCLQCHGDFPAFHDQTKGAVFTNCLKCHTEVHGSNHSRYLFR